jgi:hypothetical protein
MIRTYFRMLLEEGHGEFDTGFSISHSRSRQESEAVELGAPARDQEAAKARRENAGKMKQFASWFTHGVPGGAGLRKAIYEARTGTEILDAVERFFEGRLSPGFMEQLGDVMASGEPLDEMVAGMAGGA